MEATVSIIVSKTPSHKMRKGTYTIVCKRIMPNPIPCNESNTANHNHNALPKIAEATGPPAQGRYCPTPDVAQRI
jgi:hypothetical protein